MQLGHEHLFTAIECNDDLSMAGMFKTNNAVKRAGPLEFSSFMQVSDQSTLGDKLGTYGSNSDVDNLTNSDLNGHKVVASHSLPPPPFEIVKTETEFYMDKVVTEMELPKMIVCYKEGSYHIIKDICVDEGLHSFDSVLVQNPFLDEKVYTESKPATDDFTHKEISDSLKSLHLNQLPTFEDRNEVTECAALEIVQEGGFISRKMGETVSSETQKVHFNEVLIPTQDPSRCQCQGEIIHTGNENTTECSLASLLELDRGSTGTAEGIELASGTKELIPLHKLDREHCHDNNMPSCQSDIKQPQLVITDDERPKFGNNDAENLAKESQSNEAVSHHIKYLTSSRLDMPSMSVSTSQTFYVFEERSGDQVDEGTLEEANPTTALVSSEVKEEVIAKCSPNFGRSGGTIVAFDIDCEPLTTIPGKAIKATPEIQHSELVMSEVLLDSTSTNGPTVASQHSFSHGHSDANFCERASLSGHIISGGTIVAFDIDSEPATTIPDKDSEGTSEIQQSELVMSGGLLESTTSDGPTVASQPSFGHGHSDANFPGRTSLSSRIAYSGQIPYSGSISLRSDSSTTSTRSFAFPILQSEWNTSPVRMAKADRRHFRRRQGWRSGLLCCRF